MTHSLLLVALLGSLGLVACDRPAPVPVAPVVVNTPVPGPAGPAGPAGDTGATGNTGATGDRGRNGATTVLVVPLTASAPQN